MLADSHDKVATVRQLAQLLDDVQANSPTTTVLTSVVNKLLRIYYTLPLTSATVERTFSATAMRRLKNCMRATMTQKRLNNIILTHCHKERVDALDLIAVAKTFIDSSDKRHKFFWFFLAYPYLLLVELLVIVGADDNHCPAESSVYEVSFIGCVLL